MPEDPSLATGHDWHNNLHHENIFFDSDRLQSLEIIYRQSIQVVPLIDYCLDDFFLNTGAGTSRISLNARTCKLRLNPSSL